jgi:hypothetical protein
MVLASKTAQCNKLFITLHENDNVHFIRYQQFTPLVRICPLYLLMFALRYRRSQQIGKLNADPSGSIVINMDEFKSVANQRANISNRTCRLPYALAEILQQIEMNQYYYSVTPF